MKVYLDDVRDAPRGWVRTHTFQETIEHLKTGGVTELSLDHDLGATDPCHSGYDVLVWLEWQLHLGNHKILPEAILTHTQNPVGKERMERAIEAINTYCFLNLK